MKLVRADPIHPHLLNDVRLGFIDRIMFRGEQERPTFNRHMFDEDFSMLLRSVHRKSGNLFDVASNNDEITEKLLVNVETHFSPYPHDDTICEWIEEIGQSLIRVGTAFYYIHDDAEFSAVRIAAFSSVGVARVLGSYVQWVPKRFERHWNRDDVEFPREVRILDSRKVMRFVLPTEIKRMLAIQNRTLATLDKHQFGVTDFHPQATYENPNPTNHFDFNIWRDMQDRALYRSTRSTGWNGRQYDSSKRSDFFDCKRLLRFRRNQLMLRDDILKQLSAELTRVVKDYDIQYNIKISGTDELPSVDYLNELEAKLDREEVGFKEVIDYCYKR